MKSMPCSVTLINCFKTQLTPENMLQKHNYLIHYISLVRLFYINSCTRLRPSTELTIFRQCEPLKEYENIVFRNTSLGNKNFYLFFVTC